MTVRFKMSEGDLSVEVEADTAEELLEFCKGMGYLEETLESTSVDLKTSPINAEVYRGFVMQTPKNGCPNASGGLCFCIGQCNR